MKRERSLSGVKVVDFCWVMAGPMIGRVLADFGATVVRVESARRIDLARSLGPFKDNEPGRENSIFYSDANAGKLGIALDLSTAEARAVARDLARWSDVVIDSFSPGVMNRLGLGYDELSAEHSDLIMLSTSLFGAGPYGSVAGFGSAGGALSGIHYLTGWPDRPAQGFAGPYSDAVNPRFGVMLVLAALDRRRRTGQGSVMDLSQIEATLQLLAPLVVEHSTTGQVAERHGNDAPGRSPHGVYRCQPDGDGTEWVALAVRDGADRAGLCAAMERPDLPDEPELESLVAAWTAERSAAEVEGLLQARGVPAHRVSNEHDLARDPQLLAGGHFIRLAHAAHGETAVESSRIGLDATPAEVTRAGPTIGQDTDQVLTTLLGYSAEQVAALHEADVLA